MRSVLVVGAGLIGTSIGLALEERCEVYLSDPDQARVAVAVSRGAGRPWVAGTSVELAVVAVPPRSTARVIAEWQRRDVAANFTHVASCQSQVQADLQRIGAELTSVCGGHPLAGREVSGPVGAVPGLFAGRPWVLCPGPLSAEPTIQAVTELARACGAEVTQMTAEAHDRAVALSSHLPQVTASALAAALVDAADDVVRVSGPGLQDTTRLAASDADLWVDVLSANAAFLAHPAAGLAAELRTAADALAALARDDGDAAARGALQSLLVRGNAGRARVPVKRGVLDRDVAVVGVRVPDQPGELAGLLAVAAEAAVNVEDVRVEHLAGRHTGLVELSVRTSDVSRLRAALLGAGREAVGETSAGA